MAFHSLVSNLAPVCHTVSDRGHPNNSVLQHHAVRFHTLFDCWWTDAVRHHHPAGQAITRLPPPRARVSAGAMPPKVRRKQYSTMRGSSRPSAAEQLAQAPPETFAMYCPLPYNGVPKK